MAADNNSLREPLQQFADHLDLGLLTAPFMAAVGLGVVVVYVTVVHLALKWLARRITGKGRQIVEIARLPLVVMVGAHELIAHLDLMVPAFLLPRLWWTDLVATLLADVVLLWVLWRLVEHYEETLSASAAPSGKIEIFGAQVERGHVHKMALCVKVIIVGGLALLAMSLFGVSVKSLLAFGGISGIVVGYAARDILGNLLSGLRIFLYRPFEVGDWIRCPGEDIEGVVEMVGWQATRIRTFDKRPLYVPNTTLGAAVIENPQRMTNRRIYEHFGLRYADIGRLPTVLAGIRTMLAEHPEIDKTQIIMVNFNRYGDCSLDFFVYCMTTTVKWDNFHRVKEDILLRIATIVHEHEADFAFPTRTIEMTTGQPHTGPALTPEALEAESLVKPTPGGKPVTTPGSPGMPGPGGLPASGGGFSGGGGDGGLP